MSDSVSILNVIIEAVYDRVVQKLQVETDGLDSDVGLVKIGRLQDDPTTAVTNLMVRESEREDMHEIAINPYGLNVPTYTVGGGIMWRRKFLVELDLYFLNQPSRDVARTKAFTILSRAEHAIQTMTMPQCKPGDPVDPYIDDFEESPYQVFVTKSHVAEGGGPGDFIWNGVLHFEFITNKY